MARPKQNKRKKGRTPPRRMIVGNTPTPARVAAPEFQIREDQHLAPITVGSRDPKDGTEILIGDAPDLAIPTVAFRSICSIARDDEMEMVLSEEDEKRLAPDGKHMLSAMRRVVNEDNTDFVRAHVMMQMRDMPRGQPVDKYLDFPTRYIGMLLDATKARTRQAAAEEEPQKVWRWAGKKPTWAGSYSFDHVWQQAAAVASVAYDHPDKKPGEHRVPPRHLQAMSALSVLGDAHLVRVEPEQVSVLPEWDDLGNLWDYAQDVTLPFERIYLDFEGPGGIAPVFKMEAEMKMDGHAITLTSPADRLHDILIRGALLYRDTAGRLAVTVVAWPTTWAMDRMVDLMAGDPRDPSWNEYEVAGTLTFGAIPDELAQIENKVGEVSVYLGDTGVFSKSFTAATTILTREGVEGFIQVPIDARDVVRASDRMTEDVRETLRSEKGISSFVGGWAVVVLAAAARTMAALSILEADEVEIVDAPMEKRVRDRAEKRGWNISKIVRVRPRKQYVNKKPPSGEEAHYSHRFWVRGNTAHYPIGTMMADSRPDLCRPCHRCGTCRRVKRPPCIKGPEGAPLVLKSLVIRKDDPRNVHLPEREDEKPYYKAPGVG